MAMTRRRWLQFSLRGFLIALTALAVWLGWKAERARRQREAVAAIKAIGGIVQYGWQTDMGMFWMVIPDTPSWSRRMLGDDYFHDVKAVLFPAAEMVPNQKPLVRGGMAGVGFRDDSIQYTYLSAGQLDSVIPHLQSLPGLDVVYLVRNRHPSFDIGPARISDASERRIRIALPHCRIIRFPADDSEVKSENSK